MKMVVLTRCFKQKQIRCVAILILWLVCMGLLLLNQSNTWERSRSPSLSAPFEEEDAQIISKPNPPQEPIDAGGGSFSFKGGGSSSIPSFKGGVSDARQLLFLNKRIRLAQEEIQTLRRNNSELQRLIEKERHADLTDLQFLRTAMDDFKTSEATPTDLYEFSRRRLDVEMKYLMEMATSQANVSNEAEQPVRDLIRILRSRLITLRMTDGHEHFRDSESKELAALVQHRLELLQNPKDCANAKKIVCQLNKGCGFGCQIHHVAYCLVVAYGTSRTLVLDSRGWSYNGGGWDAVFLPLSTTCTDRSGRSVQTFQWDDAKNGIAKEAQTLFLPYVDYLSPIPPFLFSRVPIDLGSRIQKVHGEAHIWWLGQFINYILRPQPPIKQLIDKSLPAFKSPIVGLHVRRTDKVGTEAMAWPLEAYMAHVNEYFSVQDKLYGKHIQRTVFIASDDAGVITQAQNAYPGPYWNILGDKGVAESAGIYQRYTNNGLNGIIRDVLLLAECDFIVCTFSSQVCRLSYEIMQGKRVDASDRFVSLDSFYYYGGGHGVWQEAILPHKPSSHLELELRVGDRLSLSMHNPNGTNIGKNQRDKKEGLYPAYKVKFAVDMVDFPDKPWWPDEDEMWTTVAEQVLPLRVTQPWWNVSAEGDSASDV